MPGKARGAVTRAAPARHLLRDLGTRVRAWRSAHNVSRATLSRRSGLSERFLASIESGRGNVSVLRLAQLARALDLAPGALLDDTPADPGVAQLLALVRPMTSTQLAATLDWIRTHRDAAPAARPVALVGLRGAGKTTLGALLARHRGVPFVQLVQEIERRAGMDVSEVFSLSGEAGYRRLEQQALRAVLARGDGAVIETGGSLVMDPDLYAELLASCHVVWLRATAQDHMRRVVAQGDTRPMANRADAMADLRRILRVRNRLYARAHATLNTSGRTVAECADALKELTSPASRGGRGKAP